MQDVRLLFLPGTCFHDFIQQQWMDLILTFTFLWKISHIKDNWLDSSAE
jgi:hypothetical protein